MRVHASSFVVGRQFRLDSQAGKQLRWFFFGHELLEYTLLYVLTLISVVHSGR